MKITYKIICLTILISNFSFSQNQKIKKNSVKYFDINYSLVTKKEFNKLKKKNSLLSIQGDSAHHKLLSIRESRGTMDNRKILDSVLTSITNKKIDATKTIVIIYYPGKDPCNSGGMVTKSSRKEWYRELEEKLFQIAQSKPIYIYKNQEGIEKYEGIMKWYKDSDGIIENLFFKYHYPCGSFVVISKAGKFISYFGEYPKDYLWKAAEILNRK